MRKRSVFRLCALSVLPFLPAAAQVTPSVFVDGAFNGSWNISSTNEPSLQGTTITFTQIDRNTGPALLNGLSDSTFTALLCPAIDQKTEYYSATYDFQGGGQLYACTNGTQLLGRYAHTGGMVRGFFEIATTTPGANPTWKGQILPDVGDGNYDLMNATYAGGGIATPLAKLTDDAVRILSSVPQVGPLLASDSFQSFTALVEYNLDDTMARDGAVRLVLLDGSAVIAQSDKLPVQAASPIQQAQLMIPRAQLPVGSGQVNLRADLLAQDDSVILSSQPLAFRYAEAAPMLTAAPMQLSYGARVATPGSIEQTVLLTKTGSGPSVDFTAEQVGDSTWIESIVRSSGQVVNTEPTLLTVTVNTQGLGVGTFVDAIRISSSLGAIDIPVTAVVNSQGSILFLTKTGLRFETRQGNGSSATGNVSVRNLGDAGSVVNWSARALLGGDFVNLAPASGLSQTNAPSNLAVTAASAGIDTLSDKYALIEVSDPNALNSPQYISVVVDVSPPNSPTIPLPSPAGFFFTGTQGGAQPASQVLTVNVSRTTNANFTASAATDDGGGWLTVDPPNGTSSTSNPGKVNVNVSTVGLASGVYRGVVNIAIGSVVRASKVTLLVQQSTAAAASADARGLALQSSTRAAGCTPSEAAIVETSLVNSYSIPASFPANLVARMFDDCGTPRGDGSVVATFSNGDPPLSLLPDDRAGDYSATWVPGTVSMDTQIKMVGTVGNLKRSTLTISGNIADNEAPSPVIASGGLLHAFNPELGAPLAPGTATQVFGSNFTSASEAAPTPLPTEFRGVEVLMGALHPPLYFVSPSQINMQVPAEAEPRSYATVVLANGIPSVPQMMNLVRAEPRVLAPDGNLVAQHVDFTFVTPESPAAPGEFLTLYLVGMGATTPPVESGQPSPRDPLAIVNIQPEVTIDGKTAEVFFAGLTPDFVGLYQINVRVPENASSGLVDVVITQNSVNANVTKLVVVAP